METIKEKNYTRLNDELNKSKDTHESQAKLPNHLLDSEEKYRTLFNSANDAILLMDREVFIECNEQALKMFRCKREQIIGKKCCEFSPLEQPCGGKSTELAFNKISDAYAGEPQFFEWIHQRLDSTNFESEVNLKKVDLSGNSFLLSIVRDITERKKADKAMRESEKGFRKILETIRLVAVNLDSKGNITFINHFLLELTGWKTEEVLSKNWFDLFIPERIRDQVRIMFFDTFKEGSLPAYYENSILNKFGDERIIAWNNTIIRDGTGKPIGTTSIGEDITDRKLAEEALRKSEKRFRNLYENATIGIYRSTSNGRIVMANPTLLKILGYDSIDHLLSLDINKDGYTDQIVRQRFLDELTENGKVHGYEAAWEKPDGTIIYLRESAILLTEEEGDEEYYEGTVEDITEKKKAEQEIIIAKEKAERSDIIKSEFLAQMSHEIRTPISSVLSFSGLIREELEDKVDDDMKTSFEIISRAGKRVIRTIDLILKMSEIQAGTFECLPRKVDLYWDILEDLYIEFKLIAKLKNLDLILHKHTDDTALIVDEGSVSQIFNNLIDNAIKYTFHGKVDLELSRNDENKLEVKVADTGIGISEEYVPNLFKPFIQEDQGYTRKFEGSGLGLAVVKKYCEMNNAEIKVNSKKGAGTTFTVTFHGN